MANVNEVYAGNWLTAEDLQMSNGQYRDVQVVIERVELQSFEDRENHQTDRKLSLHFQGKQKGMVLNKTNARMLSWAFGPDTDAWHGRQITIGVDIVPFGNRMVPGLRVRQLMQQTQAAQAPLAQPAPGASFVGGQQVLSENPAPADLDDEIPF